MTSSERQRLEDLYMEHGAIIPKDRSRLLRSIMGLFSGDSPPWMEIEELVSLEYMYCSDFWKFFAPECPETA